MPEGQKSRSASVLRISPLTSPCAGPPQIKERPPASGCERGFWGNDRRLRDPGTATASRHRRPWPHAGTRPTNTRLLELPGGDLNEGAREERTGGTREENGASCTAREGREDRATPNATPRRRYEASTDLKSLTVEPAAPRPSLGQATKRRPAATVPPRAVTEGGTTVGCDIARSGVGFDWDARAAEHEARTRAPVVVVYPRDTDGWPSLFRLSGSLALWEPDTLTAT